MSQIPNKPGLVFGARHPLIQFVCKYVTVTWPCVVSGMAARCASIINYVHNVCSVNCDAELYTLTWKCYVLGSDGQPQFDLKILGNIVVSCGELW
jgi:hypothetical protein